jgi:hypothetical protein
MQGLPVPLGVKDHQTRKLATSIADMAGVNPQDVCNAVTWASGSIFMEAYGLNVREKVSFHVRSADSAGGWCSHSSRRSQVGILH